MTSFDWRLPRSFRLGVLGLLLLSGASPAPALAQAGAASSLRVVSFGPEGEVASLAEASEIRVVFSEPMVALGRIPDRVSAPFFRVSPGIPGSFRWSGRPS